MARTRAPEWHPALGNPLAEVCTTDDLLDVAELLLDVRDRLPADAERRERLERSALALMFRIASAIGRSPHVLRA